MNPKQSSKQRERFKDLLFCVSEENVIKVVSKGTVMASDLYTLAEMIELLASKMYKKEKGVGQ